VLRMPGLCVWQLLLVDEVMRAGKQMGRPKGGGDEDAEGIYE
jgi:hypothetical protein